MKSLVFDIGSLQCKGGINGDYHPRSITSTLLALQKPNSSSSRNLLSPLHCGPVTPKKEYLVGKEIKSQVSTNLHYFHPIERGKMKDVQLLEKLWSYMFETELKVNCTEFNLLLTDNTIRSCDKQREESAQRLFESFNVPSLFFEHQSVLAMFGTGRLTGLLIDSGYGITHTIPFYEGIPIRDAIEKSEFGSQDLEHYLLNALLPTLDKPKSHNHLKSCTKRLKEDLCYVKADSSASSSFKTFELPDGTLLSLQHELSNCGELLFESSTEKKMIGIHEMAIRSVT